MQHKHSMPLLVNPAVGPLPTSQNSSSNRLAENKFTQFVRQSENHLTKPAARNRRYGPSSEPECGIGKKEKSSLLICFLPDIFHKKDKFVLCQLRKKDRRFIDAILASVAADR
ncbi:hypothetical protein [Paraburkholderia sp. PGU19]|uniref:hypothetical protein n=1 Tax=Paraburkholderia sp. PGU19 TaxID=2735434 RepID=UPI0015DAE41C|nr:hypothetical protein [Paraburkholderia sp. PGU19]